MLDIASLALAAGLLPAMLAGHGLYYRWNARVSTRQIISIRDDSKGTIPVLSIAGPLSGTRQPVESVITMHHEQIVHGSLKLSGRHRHAKPLKVTGDLVIEGSAEFDQPVFVNGRVHVIGEASFHMGLLAKQDLKVDGHARFGTDASGSWCIANRVAGKVVYAPTNENLKTQDLLTA